jgi:hypothetical protein
VMNATIYNQSGTTLTFNGVGTNPFMNVTGADSTLFRERQVQFAARLEF